MVTLYEPLGDVSRVVAGGSALPLTPSNWLFGFSIFPFFGLAMVESMGVASSFLSVLVLVLVLPGTVPW